MKLYDSSYMIQDSTVQKIRKTVPLKKTKKGLFGYLKGTKHFKGNKKRAGKPS